VYVCVYVCVLRMCNPAHGASDHPFAVEETYNPRWYPTGNCHTCYTSHTLGIRENAEYGVSRRSSVFVVEIAQSLKDVSPIHSRNPSNTPPSWPFPLYTNIIQPDAPLGSTEGDARGLVSSGRDRSTLGRESSRRRASLTPRHHDMYNSRVQANAVEGLK